MIMDFIVKPYQCVGEYVFGTMRESIQETMGEPLSSVNYGYPISDRYLDDYGFLYMLFSNKSVLEAIQIFPEYADDDIFLVYGDVSVSLKADFEEIIDSFQKITDDFIREDDSYSSIKLGVKIFCPDDYIEDIIIFDKHYYD
jgi:hypothetical protein